MAVSRRASHWRTRLTMVVAMLLAAQATAQAIPVDASAAPPSTVRGQLWSSPSKPTAPSPVPGSYRSGAATKNGPATASHPYQIPTVDLPAAGTVDVSLAGQAAGTNTTMSPAATRLAALAGTATLAQVGGSPIYLASAGSGSPSRVRAQVAGAATVSAAGLTGLALGLTREDGATGSAPLNLVVDTAALRGLYGGDYADRLTVQTLPACVLTTPQVAACRTATHLAATADHRDGVLSTMVTVSGSTPLVVALTSAPTGSAGTYTATSIKPSDQWSAGGSTGDFTYTYPLTLPPSLGGAAPNVTLAYASSSVDGLNVSTNSQSSWIGDGWSYTPGSIERVYQPCSQDGISGVGDNCWGYGGHEVTASGSGIAGQVVWDDNSQTWRMGGSAATVQLLQGADNGAYAGEYWLVTESDGTRYYYGAGHLPGAEGGTGSDPATQSAWTQPVYCPKSGDGPAGHSCYSSDTGTGSYAKNMAWRWNLDFVVDPHGNATEYTYGTETNYYARHASSSNLTAYTRGGYLNQVDYGWRAADIAAEGASPAPAAEVVFTIAERCTVSTTTCQYANLSSSSAKNWPDVPYDQNCNSGATNCLIASETYWSTKRVTQIQTMVNAGTVGTPSYKAVDTYTLNQSFNDPGDGTSPALRLDSIARTGVDTSANITGGTAPLPAVAFTYIPLPNRVPGAADYPAVNHFRISEIVTENGGAIDVTYSTTPTSAVKACDQTPGSSVLPTPSNDNMLCYQEYWTPPNTQALTADWFEKYVATSVRQKDPTGGSPDQATIYTYVGAPAWHRNDSPFTPNDHRTWDSFRGFGQVITNTGIAPDPVTQTEVTYLRGMDGDSTSRTGGSPRSVTLTTTMGDSVTDANQLAGTTLEAQTFASAASGAPVQLDSESLPWSQRTASHAETSPAGVPAENAYYTGTASTTVRTLSSTGAWRTTKTVNSFDPSSGRMVQVDDQGDLSLVGTAASQETCATTSFATAPASDPQLTDLPARQIKVFVTTGGPVGTGTCPAATVSNTVSDTVAYYDGNTSSYGAVGTTGDVTMVKHLDSFSGSTPAYTTAQSANSYDAYGRLKSTTNASGDVTTTSISPATGTLPTTVTTTDVTMGGWTTTTTMSRARQLPIKVVDPNGNATTEKYDALGRLVGVWLPGQGLLQPANRAYKYSVNGTSSPTWVLTSTLRDDNTYANDYLIYDGFMQPRQDQSTSLDGLHGSLVTDTFYDSHGWAVQKSSPYSVSASPTFAIFTPTHGDSDVPAQTRTAYDGRGRAVTSTFLSYANAQWATTTAYPGEDRTDVTPPSGGTPTSTFTDALGHTAAVWRFTTSTINHAETYTAGAPAPADAVQLSYASTNVAGGVQTSATDSLGHVWTNTYDYHANMVASTDPDTSSSTATYYPNGLVKTTTTNGGGRVIGFVYDALGRKTSEHAGSTTGPLIATWGYDTATGGKGQLASSVSYDSAGNAYTQTITGYTNRYAPTGVSLTIPSTISGDESPLAGTYTETTTYTPNAGLPQTTTYNADGGLPSETVTTRYTSDGAVANVSGIADYLAGVTVDAWGRTVKSWMGDMPNQVTATSVVDTATGRTLEATLDKETSTAHVEDITTTWNPAGAITSTKDVQDGTNTDLQCYGYDALGRLATAWTDTAGTATAAAPEVAGIGGCATGTPSAATVGGPAPYWQSYGYNNAGDRSSETDHDVTGNTANDVKHTYAYPNVTGTGGTPNETQRVTTATGSTTTGVDSYTYNADGSTRTRVLATGANQTISYDAAGRTQSVTDGSNGSSATYTYDAGGGIILERDATAKATSATLYLPSEQITLTIGGTALAGLRYYSTGAVTEVRSSKGGLTYEYGNSQGTESTAIDAGTLQVARRYFTAYGAKRGTSPVSWIDNRGFLDQPTDTAIGLNLLGARLYDPAAGRFLQRDIVYQNTDTQQLGGYTYAADDPVNRSDPSGTDPWWNDPGVGAPSTPPATNTPVTVTPTGPGTVSVTQPGWCRCRTGTVTTTYTAPKYIIVNGQHCTTAQCQNIALLNWRHFAGIAAGCGNDPICVDKMMGVAQQPLTVNISTATQYAALGIQPPKPKQSGSCSLFSMCTVKLWFNYSPDNVAAAGRGLVAFAGQCVDQGGNCQKALDNDIIAVLRHATVSIQGCAAAFCASLTFQDGYLTLAWDVSAVWFKRYKGTKGFEPIAGKDMAKQVFAWGIGVGFNNSTPDKASYQAFTACGYLPAEGAGPGGCVTGWPGKGGNVGANVGVGEGWMLMVQPQSVTVPLGTVFKDAFPY